MAFMQNQAWVVMEKISNKWVGLRGTVWYNAAGGSTPGHEFVAEILGEAYGRLCIQANVFSCRAYNC
jgi:hypothetical protein